MGDLPDPTIESLLEDVQGLARAPPAYWRIEHERVPGHGDALIARPGDIDDRAIAFLLGTQLFEVQPSLGGRLPQRQFAQGSGQSGGIIGHQQLTRAGEADHLPEQLLLSPARGVLSVKALRETGQRHACPLLDHVEHLRVRIVAHDVRLRDVFTKRMVLHHGLKTRPEAIDRQAMGGDPYPILDEVGPGHALALPPQPAGHLGRPHAGLDYFQRIGVVQAQPSVEPLPLQIDLERGKTTAGPQQLLLGQGAAHVLEERYEGS